MKVVGIYPGTLLACFLVVITRGWGRLIAPDLWAEDGTIFVSEGLRHGLSSLFIPCAGYFHTLQRAIAVAAIHLLPLSLLPAALCLSSYLVFSAFAATMARPVFRWLIPSDRLRVAAALLMCMAPGLGESLGNLANLNWTLVLCLGLLALKDLSLPMTIFEVCFALLVVLSSGTFVILLPVFVGRWWLGKRDPALMAVIGLLIVGTLVLWAIKDTTPVDLGVVLASIPTLLVRYLTRGLLLQPLLGDWITTALASPRRKFWEGLITLTLLALTGRALYRDREERSVRLLLLFLGGLATWPVLGWLSRPLSIERFTGTPLFFWNDRYAFPLGVASLWLWLTILRHSKWALGFVTLSFALSLYRFELPSYGPERRWQRVVPLMESARSSGVPTSVFVECYPDGHHWTYHREAKR